MYVEINQAVIEFKQWKAQNPSCTSDEQYQKLLWIYRSTLKDIAHIPWIWTTLYMNCLIPKQIDNKSNPLYEAMSQLISIKKVKEGQWNDFTTDEKLLHLNKINEDYRLTDIHFGWLSLHKAENPNLGKDADRIAQALEYLYKALSLKDQNDYMQAKEYFDKSLLIDPTNGAAEIIFAFTLKDYAFSPKMADKRVHLLKESEEHFRKAIELNLTNPMWEQAYALLLKDWAVNINDKSKFKEAKKHFERAIDIDPDNIAIQQAFFYFYVDYERAIDVSEKAPRVIDDRATVIKKASKIFSHYNLGRVIVGEEVIWGFINRIYLVETTKGTFVLKQCVGHPTPEEIIFEYNLINYLKERGLPVASILKHSEQENEGICVTFEDKNYIVSEYLEGSHIMWSEIRGERLENVARALARYHHAVKSYTYTEPIKYKRQSIDVLIENFKRFDKIMEMFANREQESLPVVAKLFMNNYDYLAEQIESIKHALFPVLYNEMDKVIIHGDYHPLNIKFKNNDISGIFDWDAIGEDIKIYDIVICLVKMQAFAKKGGSAINEDLLHKFITAYQEENQLSKDEILAIPDIFRVYLIDEILFRFKNIEDVRKDTDQDNKLCLSFLYNVHCLKLIDKGIWQELLSKEPQREVIYDIIKTAVDEFKHWKSRDPSSNTNEEYAHLSGIYLNLPQKLNNISWVWTTLYRDSIIPQILNNKPNPLYKAVSNLINLQVELEGRILSKEQQVPFLNLMFDKYHLNVDPYNWVILNIAHAPDIGGDRINELTESIRNLKLADSLKVDNKFAEAVDYFNKAILLDSANAHLEIVFAFSLKDWAFASGMEEKRLEMLKEAEPHFNRAIELCPRNGMYESACGILYKDWAMNLDDFSKFELSKKHFERAMDLDTYNVAIQQGFYWFYVDYENARKKQLGIKAKGQRNIDNTKVSTEKAKKILVHYDLGEVKKAEEVIWGFVNRIYLVQTTKGTFVLKQCVEHSTPEEVEFEYNLVKYLKRNGFPVADIYEHTRKDSANFYIQLDHDIYIVCEYIDGSQILFYSTTGAKLENMARTLALYHIKIREYEPSKDIGSYSCHIFSIMHRLMDFDETRNVLENRNVKSLSRVANLFFDSYEYIMKKVEGIKNNFPVALYDSLPKLLVHGDYDSLNIKFKNEKVVGVFDWDCVQKEIRIYDIIRCLFKMQAFTGGGDEINMDMISDFLKAYTTVNSLSRDEIQVIPEVFIMMFLEDILIRLNDIENAEPCTDMDNKLCLSIVFNLTCLKMIDKQDWTILLKEV